MRRGVPRRNGRVPPRLPPIPRAAPLLVRSRPGDVDRIPEVVVASSREAHGALVADQPAGLDGRLVPGGRVNHDVDRAVEGPNP